MLSSSSSLLCSVAVALLGCRCWCCFCFLFLFFFLLMNICNTKHNSIVQLFAHSAKWRWWACIKVTINCRRIKSLSLISMAIYRWRSAARWIFRNYFTATTSTDVVVIIVVVIRWPFLIFERKIVVWRRAFPCSVVVSIAFCSRCRTTMSRPTDHHRKTAISFYENENRISLGEFLLHEGKKTKQKVERDERDESIERNKMARIMFLLLMTVN